MKYKDNWEDTKQRFEAWWSRSSLGRPMLRVASKKPAQEIAGIPVPPPPATPEDMHIGIPHALRVAEYGFQTTNFNYAEAFPAIDLNMGPGSLACYLGSEPIFKWDTVWFSPCVPDGWQAFGPLRFDPENPWWQKHWQVLRAAVEAAQGDYLVNIPDLIENVDVLSAMRDPQTFCYDLIDEPETVRDYTDQLDALYFQYYDPISELVACDGGTSYTAFSIWGKGRTAKVQCDFSALMSPAQFRDHVLDSLQRQLARLDHSLYHLDGPDAVRHLDALMELDRLDALQWTPGAGRPDPGDPLWYPIHDKVHRAGKSLWISLSDGGIEDWLAKTDRLVDRYGADGLYMLYPTMQESEALRLMERAETRWR